MNLAVLISNAFGYASIVCWIVVLAPQIYLNYKRKSCDGVSLAFYLMWSLGDVFNLAGATMEGLIFTAILLPLYYIFTDCIVLWQFYIYRNNHVCAHDEERSPLFDSSNSRQQQQQQQQQSTCNCTSGSKSVFSFSTRSLLTLSCFALLIIPTATYYFSTNPKWLTHLPIREILAQLCGYISAVVYLGAYIPQLIRNYRTKSTEGLSMLMFIIVIVANVTYCFSILTSQKLTFEYLKTYASWLIGASGTIWLELAVLYQFHLYCHNASE